MQPAPEFPTRPGANDYALVLCVASQEGDVSAPGASVRAAAFVQWLIAPTGGGLPGDHVHALVGDASTIGAASLRQMLTELVPDYSERLASGGTIGRRCYVYLGGSAIGPPNDLRLIARDTTGKLRALDASLQRFVESLRVPRIFEEVVAFADVLRLSDEAARAVQVPTFPSTPPLNRGSLGIAFVGISDPAESPTTTRPPDDSPTSDLVSFLGFTGAIIEALTDGAPDETGAITAESFVEFMGARLEQWLGTSARMPRYEYNTTPPFVFFKAPMIPVAPDPFARMPNAYALLIGIDDYVTISRLWSCADDARALGFALASPSTGGYDAANVRVLTDRDATRDTVIAEFARLASECDSESTVFVWFSGRAHVENGDTTLFLADDRLDAPVKGLTAMQLNAMLDSLRAARIVVVIDTSGGGAGLYARPGRVILSATLPEEHGFSGTNGTPGGDFTNAILRALNGAVASGADDVSVLDVFEYAHAEVVRLGKQHPTIGMVWGEVGFPIAKAPLAPSVPSVIDADGHAYDVHVVHSLRSPRAGFVEKVLLPALRDAGLRVAVSAMLETSPVGRVVQIYRGMRRSRRTLLLDSRASSGDTDFDDVVRLALASRPPLIDPSNLVIVALEAGDEQGSRREIKTSDGTPVLVETEPFDLISARTAEDSSVRKLIERLTQPTVAPTSKSDPEGEKAEADVPLIEAGATRAEAERDVWLFSCKDSERVLDLASSMTSSRTSLTTPLQKGDVVFLRDPDDSRVVVGISRVTRAFRYAASTSVTAGRPRPYDFEFPIKLGTPVDFVASSFIVHALDPSGTEPSARVSAEDAEILMGLCIASDPSSAKPLAQWMGKTPSELVIPLGVAALQRGTEVEQDLLLPSLISFLEGDAVLDLWSKAQEGLGRIDSGAVTRALVARVEPKAPGATVLMEALARSIDPAVRALQSLSLAANAADAAPTGRATATGARWFKYAAFFDTTSELTMRAIGTGRDSARNIVGAQGAGAPIAGPIRQDRLLAAAEHVSSELRRWRAEPVYIHRPDRGTLARALRAMRDSEAIILSWSRETATSPEWHELMTEALWIARQRAARFASIADEDRPRTILTIVVDSGEFLPPEIADQNWIDITHAENTLTRAAEEAVAFALATARLLNEFPDAPPPPLSLGEALERIVVEAGDLLEADVDAIVNPIGSNANDTGQIGKQLTQRVGPSARATLEERDSLVPGETLLAVSGGRIPARHIVHTCTVEWPTGHTADSVAVGALGAFRVAETLPSVRRIAYPALGSGDVGLDPLVVARAMLPGLVERLTRGSSIEHVKFVLRDAAALAAYARALDELRSPPAAAAPTVVAGTRWYVSVRQTSIGAAYVGGNVSLGLFFSLEESPNAVPLVVPHSAFELTIYVDATAAFHLADASQQTVQARDGWIENQSLPLRLLTLASGVHTVRVVVSARGALDAGSEVVMTCPVTVEPPVLLPNIPELIDRRTIPSPQPDVLLYVATEPTAHGDRVRIHLTCRALGYERRHLEELLPLSTDDTAAIRFAAAEAAGDLDASSPPDVRAAILAFGAMLYDVLMPPAHELRAIVGRLLALPPRGDRPITWLIISDEAAALPWELVCPHGYAADTTHWYDECLATRFVIAHWIGRRGFEMPNEAPVGPLGVVHYGQHPEAHPRWREALGAEVASDADRHLGLDILKRGSPYFGVHLLRFSDATDPGRIAEATDVRRDGAAGESITRERRLDFTLRRPIVSLSFVDALLDHGTTTAQRLTSIEQAWAVPFLLARSSAVIGPRWTTSPSSDRIFYRAFYDAVRADRPLGLAVWEAREVLRLAHPERADWLAYTYFGHPSCEPYGVEDAEGFTLFEPMGVTADQPFVAGREYLFRASFRGELPAWYNGRRHMRTTRLRGEGVRVLVASLHDGDATTYELSAASGTDGGADDDDYYRPVVLSMPTDAGTYKWFVQFTRGNEELRSTVITLDVVARETGEQLIVHDPALVESILSDREVGVQRIADERSRVSRVRE